MKKKKFHYVELNWTTLWHEVQTNIWALSKLEAIEAEVNSFNDNSCVYVFTFFHISCVIFPEWIVANCEWTEE